MKKICEIYDVSKEYQMQENSVLICVSDLEKDKLYAVLPELKSRFTDIFNSYEWQQYLEINKLYNRNESKHYMREIRQSKRVEVDTLVNYETDGISEILNNAELKSKIETALSALSSVPRKRFLEHYLENRTYRQIAEKEGRNVKTIYESVQAARKKFLMNFE